MEPSSSTNTKQYESKQMKNGSVDNKKLIRKTVSSHQRTTEAHDDGMTTSSHTRDTAGGGRAIFSNADSDVNEHFATKAHSKHGQCEIRE